MKSHITPLVNKLPLTLVCAFVRWIFRHLILFDSSNPIAEHFNFTLSTFSSHLPLLKDADLITGKKQVLFIESKGNLGIHIFLRICMTMS